MPKPEFFKSNECGQQFTGLELPDIVHLKLRGSCTLEECRQINQANFEYAKHLDYFFYLVELGELEDLPSAVRREASEAVRNMPARGTAVMNAPLRARMFAKLLLTAANLFRRGGDSNPVMFAETEEEARAWFVKRRQELVSAAAAA
jgi:hypothetical protein